MIRSIAQIMEDIENGLTVPHGQLLRLVQHTRGLENVQADDLRRSPFITEAMLGVQESIPAAVQREERPLWEYRFFRKAHKEWQEIENMMNGMAENDWQLISMVFVEGAREHNWYFSWKKRRTS